MTLKIINENITTVTSGVIAHGCNCQGKFASGVAGAIRAKWPAAYVKFMSTPKNQRVLGNVSIAPIIPDVLWVFNCFTQEFYGRDGKLYASLGAIKKSLEMAFLFARFGDYPNMDRTIHMPKIGCGLGGLNWDEVEPIVLTLKKDYDLKVNIYEIEG